MTSPYRAALVGSGSYLPERVLANADLERLVDTTNDWIVERTGIRERRIAADHESTSTMAAIAARRACEDAGVDPADLDLIVVATLTPDHLFPSTACLVQAAIGAKKAGGFDLEAACSGFMYGINVAAGMIGAGLHRNVLVVGAETLSRFVDYTDRGTCILFGDGAGAAVFTRSPNGAGVIHTKVCADGWHSHLMAIPGGGSKSPPSADTVAGRRHFIHLEGRQVSKFAIQAFIDLLEQSLAECGLTVDDVALVVPHQVNARIISAALERVGFPPEKCFVNIDRYGNTSAASVPIALDEARRQGRIDRGDTIVTLGFGAGLTWGAAVIKL